jgi:F-type H+-transporting ATPase subunit c
MKKIATILTTVLLMTVLLTMMTVSVYAAEAEPTQTGESVVAIEETEANENDVLSMKAIAAAIVVAVVGAAGAIGMAMAISKSTESMARQPEMAGKINSAMMLGLVFIETAIIYALIIAILVIFVL